MSFLWEIGQFFQYAKLILPHVALVLLTCAYTVLGASIFYTVERPHEMETKQHQVSRVSEFRLEKIQQLPTFFNLLITSVLANFVPKIIFF